MQANVSVHETDFPLLLRAREGRRHLLRRMIRLWHQADIKLRPLFCLWGGKRTFMPRYEHFRF
jgi:hypothetical protein